MINNNSKVNLVYRVNFITTVPRPLSKCVVINFIFEYYFVYYNMLSDSVGRDVHRCVWSHAGGGAVHDMRSRGGAPVPAARARAAGTRAAHADTLRAARARQDPHTQGGY